MVPGQAMAEIPDVCERVQTTWVRPGSQEKTGMETKNQRAVCGCCPEFLSMFPVSHGSNCFYKHEWEEHPERITLG